MRDREEIMVALTKTLKGNNFDTVFTEVPHSENLGLLNPEQLRLFHLDVRNNRFSSDELQKLLLRNIGRYVFSRAKLEKFRTDDDMESVAMQALRTMKMSGSPDAKGTGSELGEILLYAFLEEKLNAPKLMSKVELLTDAKQYNSGCDSVHLLSLGDMVGVPHYQMVFGTSNIVGDIKDAVDRAFDAIVRIESHETIEIQMVDSTAFERCIDSETAAFMKSIVVPTKEKPIIYDTAYGVFLGYTIGLDPSTRSADEFRNIVTNKMEVDIKNHATYIAKKIRDLHLDTHSFYFYVLPFNDAEKEKKSIMEDVMNGGSVT